MSNHTATIRIENLQTGYPARHGGGEITVSENVNATLCSGELTCLLGPNGAGKSTMLKTLSAFTPALGGKIIINGRDIASYTPSELSRTISVVLTERIDLANMSVSDLVGMGRSPYTGFWGGLSDDDRRIVAESLSLVRVSHLADRMINTLSDGERQKVMIAKALAQETPIIFLDEPTAFLDYPSKVEILQLLQQLSRLKEKTVFLSTHDLEIALQIADKVWLIDKTLGVRAGTPEDLAVSGEIGRFFRRDGIEFDRESGLFRITARCDRQIRLSGSGYRRNLVAKALLRNGIYPSDNADARHTVEVTADAYRVDGQPVSSIEKLLELVVPLDLPAYKNTVFNNDNDR